MPTLKLEQLGQANTQRLKEKSNDPNPNPNPNPDPNPIPFSPFHPPHTLMPTTKVDCNLSISKH